jgi:nitrogen fixation NifU-like protein
VNAALYDEAIKALARAAHGAGTLAAPDAVVRLDNPYCGDRIDLALNISAARIAALAHQTKGCLLCCAAASLIGLHAPGAPIAQVEQAIAALDALLAGADFSPGAWGELEVFRAVSGYPARHGCVSLPMQALRKAIDVARSRHAAQISI